MARLLGFPYPGGPHIDRHAQAGDPKATFEGLRPAEDSWDFHPYRSGRRTRFSEGEFPTIESKES